ncbi:MAG: serine hydrolase domain-containing protein [Geminicoccaceae bacterium]
MVSHRLRILATSALICLALPCSGRADEPAECGAPAGIGDGWRVAAQTAVRLDAQRLCALIDRLADPSQDNLHAVVVVRDGLLVFEVYRSGADQRWGHDLGIVAHGPEVRHDVRSVSKSVTSLLVGIALDRKLIGSVDDPALAYFPELANLRTPDKERILLRHLLAMSSGIAWDEERPYTDPKNSEIQMIRAPDPYRFVLEQPIATAPDKVWKYSGGSTQLLAGIVQRASGQRFADFAREALFEPLGITDYEWVAMPNGETAAASGLRLRPRDMAKIGQLMLNGGEWDGKRIVSAEWLQQSILPRRSSSYGYQWWTGLSVIGEQVVERAEAKGLGGQRIFVVPSLRLVVVTTAGLYVKTGIDNEGEITNGILDDHVLPSVLELTTAAPQ